MSGLPLLESKCCHGGCLNGELSHMLLSRSLTQAELHSSIHVLHRQSKLSGFGVPCIARLIQSSCSVQQRLAMKALEPWW